MAISCMPNSAKSCVLLILHEFAVVHTSKFFKGRIIINVSGLSLYFSNMKVMVLPSLREKHDEFMLRELVKRWSNHKVMVRWLSRFFHDLDRYFIARRSLPSLTEVGLTCFRDLVLDYFCFGFLFCSC